MAVIDTLTIIVLSQVIKIFHPLEVVSRLRD